MILYIHELKKGPPVWTVDSLKLNCSKSQLTSKMNSCVKSSFSSINASRFDSFIVCLHPPLAMCKCYEMQLPVNLFIDWPPIIWVFQHDEWWWSGIPQEGQISPKLPSQKWQQNMNVSTMEGHLLKST